MSADGAEAAAAKTDVRRAALWLLPLLALLLNIGWLMVVVAATPPENALFVDWTTYALGTERALDGEALYLPEQLAGPYRLPDVTPQGYIYPPPSALMFLPFSVGPEIGLAAWVIANVVVFVSGLVAVLRRELGAVRPRPLAAVLLGLLVVVPVPGTLLAPFPNGVLNANVNVALAGLLAWCWATRSRRWIPYAAGAGAAFKLFPGALALWALRRHGWRPVVIALGVAIGITVITLPVVGLDAWGAFLRALSNAQATCDGGRSSIACLAQPLVGPSVGKALGIVTGLILLVLAVRVRGEFLAFVLLTAGMLAPLADGHQHYLLFPYVLLVIGLCRLRRRRGSDRLPPRARSPA